MSAPPRRVGLFGGTFDPPHIAHLALARVAGQALALDEVRWIPAGQPWQKVGPGARAVTAAAHRVAMVRKAIEGEPHFTLDAIEIERAGASYTLDTVRAFRAREPATEWVLIIGQDQYAGLHTWHGWRELLGCVALAVAARPGVASQPAPQVQALPHRAVPLPMMDISATAIRERAAAGLDISQLVPAGVAGYIAEHGLYRRGADNGTAAPPPPPRS